MAGLPWLFVFALMAWLGMARGWAWFTIVSLLCMGMAAYNTALGRAIFGAFSGLIAQCWHALLQLVNSAAG